MQPGVSRSPSSFISESQGTRQLALEVVFVAFQSGKRANGGLESLFEIVRRLQNVRPVLITQRESEYNDRWRAAGFEVQVWKVPGVVRQRRRGAQRGRRNRTLLLLNLRMLRFLLARRIRVVHCNDGSAMAITALAARAAGVKILLNIRDTALGSRVKWIAYRLLAHQIVVLSSEMRDFVERTLAVPALLANFAAPVSFIYSIVDTERLSPLSAHARVQLRAELGIAPSQFAIAIVGALMPKKQQLELLRHLVTAEATLPPTIHFYFVGDFTPETDEYSAECLGVTASSPLQGRVHFVGYTSDPSSYYRACDLIMSASRSEGLARSTIESLACGTPVVAFDFCSAREILEQYGAGVVVAQGDFEQLHGEATLLASDPQRLTMLAQRGVTTARSLFTAPTAVSQYEANYLRLAEQANAVRASGR